MLNISRNAAVVALSFSLLSLAQAPKAPVNIGNLPLTEQARVAREIYQRLDSDATRDPWRLPDQVVSALAFKSSDVVLCLGDGDGYLARRIAKIANQVIVVEDKAAELQKSLLENKNNVQASVSALSSLGPLVSGVDTVVMVNKLDKVDNRPVLFLLLSLALKPTGRIVVIDFYKNLPAGLPKARQITSAVVTADMKSIGMRQTASFTFLPFQYFLVFQH